MTFNYTCPKCGCPMFCVSTASIPLIIRYECSCGYHSKPIQEPIACVPLPMEYREEKEKDRHVCCNCEHATCHFLDPEQCYFDCDIKVDLSEGVTDCYEDNRCSHWKRGKSCWMMKEKEKEDEAE